MVKKFEKLQCFVNMEKKLEKIMEKIESATGGKDYNRF